MENWKEKEEVFCLFLFCFGNGHFVHVKKELNQQKFGEIVDLLLSTYSMQ